MRCPLQELPIPVVVQDSMLARNNKRPPSPAGSAPAKRRNLAGQDIFSPERSFQSPLSLRRSIASASKFTAVLAGSQSPARILDFGLPRHSAGDPEKRPVSDPPLHDDVDITPTRQHPSSSRLIPSPELDYYQRVRTRRTDTDDVFDDSPLVQPSPCSYTLIPRELPPRTDPRSIHYPGFVVHQDSHLFSYDSMPCKNDREVMDDEESWKENSRVSATKNTATPRSTSFPNSFLDGDKIGMSPKFKQAAVSGTARTSIAGSPFKRNTGKLLEGKKNSRRILLDELDFEEDYGTED